jgi:hypothetical protein
MGQDDTYASAIIELGEAVDRAVQEAISFGGLHHKEVADELRRIAQGWEEAA